tara:strand:+ start:208 stop:795 length:588 start_codon:yes stop_codon:yes gene_type:complete
MMKKIKLILFFSSIIFCNQSNTYDMKSSLIPFQFLSNSKPMLYIGGIKQDRPSIDPIYAIQIQPTMNLMLGSLLSYQANNEDLSLYYNLLIGYKPKFKSFNLLPNIIQIGMHRYRFSKEFDSRWFSFSILETIKIKRIYLSLCWNKLFNKSLSEDSILISTKIKLFNNIYLQSGAITNFSPNITYSPFLLFGLNI